MRLILSVHFYCNELATLENALLAFDPIKRTVPTTRTRITANITAYSAISCPDSSAHSLRITLDIALLHGLSATLERKAPTWELGAHMMHAVHTPCQI